MEPRPMKNLSAIPHGTQVFIDTNIFVLAGGDGRLAQQCRDFLNRVRQREVAGFSATFVAAEVTHRVMVREARERLGLSSAETVEYDWFGREIARYDGEPRDVPEGVRMPDPPPRPAGAAPLPPPMGSPPPAPPPRPAPPSTYVREASPPPPPPPPQPSPSRRSS